MDIEEIVELKRGKKDCSEFGNEVPKIDIIISDKYKDVIFDDFEDSGYLFITKDIKIKVKINIETVQ